MPHQKNVLFLVPYPLGRAPSQRFRVELFLPFLKEAGIPYRIESFIDEATWKILYSKSSLLKKGWGVGKGFLKRLYVVLFVVPGYSYVFVHREAAPLGPPLFEWIISKVFRKKIIYDFDDAIWIANTSKENKIASWFKAFWKVKWICKWSWKVAGGNAYLCNYASHYNQKVVCVPTSVDTQSQHNRMKEQETDRVVIGWTGSHSTLAYLNALEAVLEKISNDFDVEVLVISDQAPSLKIPRLKFIPWSAGTEVDDLLRMNIGIMPLPDDPWSEGKCGFKLIQYLSLGIPAVASPVGVNRVIIEEGVNGYLCQSDEDWYEALKALILNPPLRQRMGEAGRKKIVEHYSVGANSVRFLSLFS